MLLKCKNAFTLAELLITLTVCASLAALLLPAIAYIRPDKNKVLLKTSLLCCRTYGLRTCKR